MSINYIGGAVISSGPDLPVSGIPEGTLFLKTGPSAGLYFYGLNPDSNTSLLGMQAANAWTSIVSLSGAVPYVIKTGDTMTGQLEVPGWLRVTAASGAQRLLIGNQDLGGTNRPGMIVGSNGVVSIGQGNSWNSNGGTFTSGLSVDVTNPGAGLTWLGSVVWSALNDGAGSALDADLLDGQHGSFYTDISNTTAGILPIAFGGTASNAAPTLGAIAYGSGSGYAFTTAGLAATGSGTGTVNQLLTSNGAGAPSWINSSSLNVGFAVNAGSANTAASAALASLLNTQVTSNWNFFVGGGASGAYYATAGSANNPIPVGMAGMMLSYSNSSAAQIAIPVSTVPTNQRMFFRGGDANTWSAWTEVITTQNIASLGGSTFVVRTGDTMSGTLNIDSGGGALLPTPGLAVFSGTNYGVQVVSKAQGGNWNTLVQGGDAVILGMQGAADGPAGLVLGLWSGGAKGLRIDSGGGVTFGAGVGIPSGDISVGGGTNGSAALIRGIPTNTGYVGFFAANGNRQGYIGFSPNNGATDTGSVNYSAGTHNFLGPIVSNGNITAFSDIRLKTDVKTIENAVDKVMAIRGVTFTSSETGKRHTGVIAQEVQRVLPEAVEVQDNGYLSVAYGNMVGLLIEAIQQHQRTILRLEREIDELRDSVRK